MSNWRGDYMGFTYNNVHSSDLGIVRVSDGSRFNENLLPTMQDKTVPVPGGDGSYFFGSYYTQRQFNISFAFDDLTEEQLARIRSHFGDKQIYDLIFDEAPYKVYSAKVTGTATLKYIPFAEGATGRLYKGEGTIQFTCFYPFARCWSNNKDDYKNHRAYQHYDDQKKLITDENWKDRVNEWWAASRIENGGNFGDVPVPFKLDLEYIEGADNKIDLGEIDWSKLPAGTTAQLDTRTGLVLEYIMKDTDDGPEREYTGDILNEYVTGDLTVKIPEGAIATDIPTNAQFTCEYI